MGFMDKSRTFDLASSMGVPVPSTIKFSTREELLNIDLPFPFIIKPAFSSGSRGLYRIESKETQEKIADLAFQSPVKYVAQDLIPTEKNAICVTVLYSQTHKLKAAFANERLSEYPRGGGPSVLR